ncbi:Uncharacterised protein [Bordetella pertussis]|nr:Uncharacterised protein [Bordetella pertussis]
MDEGIHLAGFFGGHVLGDVEILDLAGDVRRQRGRVETGDAADAGTSVDDIVPGAGNVVAHGANDTQAGDDDSSLHGRLLKQTK